MAPIAGPWKCRSSDDGVGFDLAAVPHGLGVDNLAARAAKAGGTFTVTSGAEGGTIVTWTAGLVTHDPA